MCTVSIYNIYNLTQWWLGEDGLDLGIFTNNYHSYCWVFRSRNKHILICDSHGSQLAYSPLTLVLLSWPEETLPWGGCACISVFSRVEEWEVKQSVFTHISRAFETENSELDAPTWFGSDKIINNIIVLTVSLDLCCNKGVFWRKYIDQNNMVQYYCILESFFRKLEHSTGLFWFSWNSSKRYKEI